MSDVSHDPRTGTVVALVPTSSAAQVHDVVARAAAAAPAVAAATPAERRRWLVALADADDWPTGVAVTWAQQHGGPWPATTSPSATSVGAAALDRFTRPVTWQSAPGMALPPALQDDNPWRLPRRVDGRLVP